MEAAFSPSNTSLEGVWHRAIRTDWAWRYSALYWGLFNLCLILYEFSKVWYYSSAGIIYISDPLARVMGHALGCGIAVLPFSYWMDRNKIPAMLEFDDAGLAMKLKSGLVVEAGWDLVKGVKYDRWTKLTVIGIKGMFFPFTGNFPEDVKDALVARKQRMRQGPPEPTAPAEPTLEDKVDQRLAANARM